MLGTLILGILAGYLARLISPKPKPTGIIATILLGIAGAFVGYLLFTEVLGIGDTEAFDLGGLPGAIIGAWLILYLHRKFILEPLAAKQRRR